MMLTGLAGQPPWRQPKFWSFGRRGPASPAEKGGTAAVSHGCHAKQSGSVIAPPTNEKAGARPAFCHFAQEG
jgi:hypothetical protein